jgi:hypothetical protein
MRRKSFIGKCIEFSGSGVALDGGIELFCAKRVEPGATPRELTGASC